uniref:Uncharacterized protein n=1 Tax=Ditylum brightwellii TaxID=49249 RepID=A0A7S1Z7W9_9STRA
MFPHDLRRALWVLEISSEQYCPVFTNIKSKGQSDSGRNGAPEQYCVPKTDAAHWSLILEPGLKLSPVPRHKISVGKGGGRWCGRGIDIRDTGGVSAGSAHRVAAGAARGGVDAWVYQGRCAT